MKLLVFLSLGGTVLEAFQPVGHGNGRVSSPSMGIVGKPVLGNHQYSKRYEEGDRALWVSTTTTPEITQEIPLAGTAASTSAANKLEIASPPSPSMSLQELPLIQLALAGSFTTFFADLSMHPIDCIKTVQQSDMGVNFGILQAARYLYEKDGTFGFFRGFLTYATSDAIAGSLKFGVWETWKKKLPVEQEPAVWLLMMGAALSFVTSSVLVVPGELVKQQLQMAQYDGLWEALQGIASSEAGIQGFFAGYDGVLYRDIPYTMMELGLYDMFKRMLSQNGNNDEKETIWDQLLCAALTGAITALATTPMDVVKTKLMVDHYSSFGDAFVSTVQNHGVGALFSGVVARVTWIVPFTAIYLPTYDALKNILHERHCDHMTKKTKRVGYRCND
eukprot:CAMPEP_0172450638 /NCGR_PEP_ID=MMETSP1065-20121228/8900_1 /TAXON_ID=265537 /ORGANISM="Amphiprora paludosa, Strain CCMP125" /LENGTH=389 /DNA_ID=CAMNT_0013202435 /DNA_START=85 /DNA_END=1254 /DNA_ORIENTATION=+